MRTLHICSYYIEDKFYTLFFRELENQDLLATPYVFANKKLKAKKIDVDVSFCFNTFDRLFFHLKHRKVWKDFVALHNPREYDLLHAHSFFSNGYIAYRSFLEFKTPYVVSIRYPDVYTFFKHMRHLRPLGKRIALNASHLIFLSPQLQNEFYSYFNHKEVELLKQKSSVIPNGVDDFWLQNLHYRNKMINKPTIHFINVARLNPIKNPEAAVKVIELLNQKGYEVKLKFFGKIEHKKYIDFLKNHPHVEYCGFTTKEELREQYRKADIFIMLSKLETFGLVYIEAMTQGLPVIMVKNQGVSSYFQDGEVGYSINLRRLEEAVHSVRLITDNYATISHRCTEKAKEFSWKRVVEKHKKIYFGIGEQYESL